MDKNKKTNPDDDEVDIIEEKISKVNGDVAVKRY